VKVFDDVSTMNPLMLRLCKTHARVVLFQNALNAVIVEDAYALGVIMRAECSEMPYTYGPPRPVPLLSVTLALCFRLNYISLVMAKNEHVKNEPDHDARVEPDWLLCGGYDDDDDDPREGIDSMRKKRGRKGVRQRPPSRRSSNGNHGASVRGRRKRMKVET
jgi:hypothetical protein